MAIEEMLKRESFNTSMVVEDMKWEVLNESVAFRGLYNQGFIYSTWAVLKAASDYRRI